MCGRVRFSRLQAQLIYYHTSNVIRIRAKLKKEKIYTHTNIVTTNYNSLLWRQWRHEAQAFSEVREMSWLIDGCVRPSCRFILFLFNFISYAI